MNIYSILFSLSLFSALGACTRFTYQAEEGTVVVGRTMDWMEDLKTDLWAYPAGLKKKGGETKESVTWEAKYGSVIASGYNLGATDGINTEGLVANLLYLATSDYGSLAPGQQSLNVFDWAQYALDNFATVDEAVIALSQKPFYLVAKTLPNGSPPSVHLALSDKSGDNAIFEYINGKLVVFHGKEYKVMTNDPPYEKQLNLNEYWQTLKGCFLPGTTEPTDRFVRASYYLNHAPVSPDERLSIAVVFSILSNVSQPMTKSDSSRPNQAATLWRSASDAKRLRYFFANTDRPNIFWVDLNKLDLKAGSVPKKLPLANGETYVADASASFVK